MSRINGNKYNEMRNVRITRDYLKHPDGSVLIELGDTKVICTAMIEDRVPFFLKGSNTGWITSEYSMLPGSTGNRKIREAAKGRIEGRTQEIQRLIGRSLRGVVDLSKLGERTIWIDCDVIQADGGTRTASITGAFVAMVDALYKLYESKMIEEFPVDNYLAAISVGIVEGEALLDLCYEEDSTADVDMNLVMTGDGDYIELQGTGERTSYSRSELNRLLDLGEEGIRRLIEIQKECLSHIGDLI